MNLSFNSINKFLSKLSSTFLPYSYYIILEIIMTMLKMYYNIFNFLLVTSDNKI